MIAAPDGVVTLVFAEIDGAPFPVEALARLEARGGYEVKCAAGRLMAAFASAAEAARFAMESAESAPLRVGAHTGEPIRETDPTTGRIDYFGPAVNRAARIADAAHPGQSLLSAPALEAAALSGPVITPLGEHRLKGLERPEPIFQIASTARQFPPLRTLTARPTNLPVQTTSFVGRERELADLGALLSGSARLVALTGPAGVGKTRLAVRLAADLLDRFEGGCWFVDLAESGAALETLVGQALNVQPDQAGVALAARKAVLLIVDTWDAAPKEAAAAIAGWLARATGLRVLVTGRAATGLPGEREIRVDPFPLPENARPADAIRLFVERAREAKPDFTLTPDSEIDVAAIVRDLEGIPLAIELAASRAKIMQPSMMRKKLGQKFQVLKSARQDAARRQQTLAGAIEWGLETLAPEERTLFRKLSVFRGGFLAEYAAQVVGPEATPERIESLRARSLLSARDFPWGRRYILYRLLHEFAEREWENAASPEDRLALERAHAEAALAYSEKWVNRVSGPGSEPLDRLEAARDNIVAVLERSVRWFEKAATPEEGSSWLAAAIRAALALQEPATHRGSLSEWLTRCQPLRAALLSRRGPALPNGLEPEFHLAWSSACRATGQPEKCDEALRRAAGALGASPPPATEVHVLRARAYELAITGAADAAEADLDRSETVARRTGDPILLAEVLNSRGLVARRKGDLTTALDAFEKCASLLRDAGRPGLWLAFVFNLASAYKVLGRIPDAIRCLDEADRVAKDAGRARNFAHGTVMRAALLLQLGRNEEALKAAEDAEAILRDFGRANFLASALGARALALARLGRLPEAVASFERAEAACRAFGDAVLTAACLFDRADALAGASEFARALPDADAAMKLFQNAGNTLNPPRIQMLRSRCFRGLGRFAEARSAIERAEAEAEPLPRPIRGAIRGENAHVAAAEGKREEAAKMAGEALALLGPEDVEALSPEDKAVREALAALCGHRGGTY